MSHATRPTSRQPSHLLLATLAWLVLTTQAATAFDLNNHFMKTETAFSANQVTTSGKDTINMRVHQEDQKIRMDISEQGQNVSVIMRGDLGTNYMLMHEMSMVQEVKNKRIEQFRKDDQMRFTNQQKVGNEDANGYPCSKYTADFVDGDGKQGSGTFWVTKDNIVVRAAMVMDGRRRSRDTTMNLTDLKVGDQPDELFEVPAGYNSLNFGNLMSRSMQQQQRPRSDQELSEQEGPTSDSTSDSAYPQDQRQQPAEQDNKKEVRKALGRLFGRGNG